MDGRPDITIRNATPADLAVIVEFNANLAWETEHKKLDLAVLTRGVKRGMAAPEMARYFMAEVDGKVVGQTMVTFELTDWRDGVFWWIQSVYVRQEYRGKGVFRALYSQIESLARQVPGVVGLRLYVERDNATAIKTYTNLGMSEGGYVIFESDWTK